MVVRFWLSKYEPPFPLLHTPVQQGFFFRIAVRGSRRDSDPRVMSRDHKRANQNLVAPGPARAAKINCRATMVRGRSPKLQDRPERHAAPLLSPAVNAVNVPAANTLRS